MLLHQEPEASPEDFDNSLSQTILITNSICMLCDMPAVNTGIRNDNIDVLQIYMQKQ